jgi:hypothetical protein
MTTVSKGQKGGEDATGHTEASSTDAAAQLNGEEDRVGKGE